MNRLEPVADRRGPDRRQGPRRTEDARLHYATEALIAAAEQVADAPLPERLDALVTLVGAVDRYRAAETAAHPEWAS